MDRNTYELWTKSHMRKISHEPLDRRTFNASFLSLFIALNCFILESTALSMGLSDASSLIHGCSKMNIQMQKYQLKESYTYPF